MIRQSTKPAPLSADEVSSGRPVNELRARGLGQGEIELSIWQRPSVATPRLQQPERPAALKGRPLRLVENRVFKRLKSAGVNVHKVRKG